jgi:hypothetical protein
MSYRYRFPALRCRILASCCCLVLSAGAEAVTLTAKAKAEGCTGRPMVVEGTSLYKCATKSGMHYFNVEGVVSDGGGSATTRSGSSASPQGFPKVDSATQKSRDSVRRKVLVDEMSAEQKLLAEAKAAYANGNPPATQDEKEVPQRYAERVARLRQAVTLHEKNIAALEKELASTR